MKPADLLGVIYHGAVPARQMVDLDAGGGADVIYFVQAVTGGPVKIGTTRRSVRKRLEEMQTGNPQELTLLGYLPGGRDVERRLHRVFAHVRYRGEWFHPAPEVMEFIRDCCLPPWDEAAYFAS